MVRALRHLSVRFDRLYYAPPLRSIETANALTALLDGESTVTNRLCEPPNETQVAQIEGKCVAIVGPAAHLETLAAWLLQGNTDQRAFVLPPAGLAWLIGELAPGKMRLRALLPPRVQRVLA
jgi:phosphohistidine phosphatase